MQQAMLKADEHDAKHVTGQAFIVSSGQTQSDVTQGAATTVIQPTTEKCTSGKGAGKATRPSGHGGRRSSRRDTQLSARVCHEGHPLEVMQTDEDGYFCNECDQPFPAGTTLHGCSECDWDICQACLASSETMMECSFVAPDKVRRQSERGGRRPSRRDTQLSRCHEGHPLEVMQTDEDGYFCNECEEEFPKGATLYGCAECDWDVCHACLGFSESVAKEASCSADETSKASKAGNAASKAETEGKAGTSGKASKAATKASKEERTAGKGAGKATRPSGHGGRRSSRRDTQLSARVCHEGHPLEVMQTDEDDYFCNECDQPFPAGTTLHGCSECDWDICQACLASSETMMECSFVAPDKVRRQSERGGRRPSRRDTQLSRCHEGHPLEVMQTDEDGYFCNECEEEFPKGATLYGCAECDWDVCHACLGFSESVAKEASCSADETSKASKAGNAASKAETEGKAGTSGKASKAVTKASKEERTAGKGAGKATRPSGHGGRRSSRRDTQLSARVCHEGHPLEVMQTDEDDYFCNECDQPFPAGTTLHGCSECDWDICQACLASSETMMECSFVAPDKVRRQSERGGRRPSRRDTQLSRCHEGHPLEVMQTDEDGYFCNECEEEFPKGATLYGCAECDWDVCHACLGFSESVAKEASCSADETSKASKAGNAASKAETEGKAGTSGKASKAVTKASKEERTAGKGAGKATRPSGHGGRRSSRRDTQLSARVCHEGHPLEVMQTDEDDYFCNECDQPFPAGTTLHGCSECDWDICQACLASSETMMECSFVAPDKVRRQSERGGRRPSRRDTQLSRCHEGHPLEVMQTDEDGYFCNECEEEFLKGATLYGCAECDWDVCHACLGFSESVAKEASCSADETSKASKAGNAASKAETEGKAGTSGKASKAATKASKEERTAGKGAGKATRPSGHGGRRSSRRDTQLSARVCHEGHPLEVMQTDEDDYFCNECDQPFPAGTTLHGCSECDWDICQACLASSETMMECSFVAPDKVRRQSERGGRRPSRRDTQLSRCHEGHPLEVMQTDEDGYFCNECEEEFPKGATLYGCAECDWDVCHACLGFSESVAKEASCSADETSKASKAGNAASKAETEGKAGTSGKASKAATKASKEERTAGKGAGKATRPSGHGGRRSSRRDTQLSARVCHEGHPLEVMQTDEDDYFCNECDQPFPAGTTLHGCSECDWDICQACLASSETMMECSFVAPDKVRRQSERGGRRPSRRDTQLSRCHEGHPLEVMQTDEDGYFCNECEEEFPKGATLYGCAECDWDVCHACLGFSESVAKEASCSADETSKASKAGNAASKAETEGKAGTSGKASKAATKASKEERTAGKGAGKATRPSGHGGRRSSRRDTQLSARVCHEGHPLEVMQTDEDGYFCNECDQPFPAGTTLHGCSECDWDICQACLASSETMMECSFVAPDKVRRQSERGGRRPSRRDTQLSRCHEGHPLEVMQTDEDGYFCNECEEEFLKGATLYGCAECDWDVCHACLGFSESVAKEASCSADETSKASKAGNAASKAETEGKAGTSGKASKAAAKASKEERTAGKGAGKATRPSGHGGRRSSRRDDTAWSSKSVP